MAIAIVKTGGYDWAQFIIDTADEAADLPTVGYGPGSEAFCVETGETYIMSAGREWGVKLTPASVTSDDASAPDVTKRAACPPTSVGGNTT